MKIITQQEAETILKPHLPIIRQIMEDSLAELNDLLYEASSTFNTTTKCRMFLDLAIGRAKKAFNNIEGIRLIIKYQSMQIIFNQRIVARIKKLNKKNTSSNVQTKRNDAIKSQQLKLDLDITPTFIDLNYKIDLGWLSFENLYAACRINDTVQWQIEYNQTEENSIIVPITKEVNPSTKEELQIRIKKTDEDQQ